MFRFRNLICLAGMCALILALGCTKADKSDQVYTVVVTQPVGASTGAQEMSLPGVVKEAQNVKAAFKAAGQLMNVAVKEGDYVRQGQLLATLDDVDYQIGVDAIQAQYTQLKNEVARVKQLYERGSVSANEYEKAVYGLEQVEAQLRSKKNQVDYTRLYSPATGYVEDVYYHKGEMVDAGTPILALINGTNMQIEVNIPQNVYKCRDQLSDFNAMVAGTDYNMSLLSITPKADGTQMYKMLLGFPSGADASLASGTNVTVRFALSGNEDAPQGISIPVSAIFYEGSQPCVWVVQPDNTVTKRVLTLSSLNLNGMAGVEHGLNVQDTIVRAGVKHLHEGDHVEILDRECSTNVGEQL